jgi:multidrug resistance efflux pump
MTPLPPIPTPLPQRLRDLRLRVLPGAMVAACAMVIAVLWHNNISAPQFVGQAEPVLASLSSHKPGTVAMLNVVRFQKVRAGDVVGQVLVADPKVVESSLAVIRAELDNLKATLSPLIQQQRNAVNFAQLRLAWMRQRADLAGARVNQQLAEVEFRREEELFKNKLVSESERDIAKASRDAQQQQADELAKLVAAGENDFTNMQPAGAEQMTHLTDDPMHAAIAVQEAKLQFTEAELAPVLLRAPMDGIITAVNHRSGESVTAGEPVVAIASEAPVRIIGYLRAPNLDAAKVGMKVRVRSRNAQRETALAQITELGAQLATPPLALATPMNPGADLALPVEISVPSNLKIRPGELLDIALVAD